MVVGWTNLVDDKLDSAAKVAVLQQKSAIASASNELLKEQIKQGGTASKLNLKKSSLGLIAGALGFTLALGSIIGGFSYKIATESINLPLQDKKLLDWAKSPEGRSAQSIYNKNAGIIKTCQQRKENLGACIILVN